MSYAEKFRRGVAWSSVGSAGNNLISFLVFALVVRAVEPSVIGVMAVALVFVDMGKIFVYAGVPDLIVRQKVWSDGYAMMCFWLNLVMAALSAALVIGVVGPLAETYFAPGTLVVLVVLSSCFIIDGIRVVPESILRRDLDYKSLARRGVSANLVSGILGVTMALTGWGIWALVVQRISSSLLTTIFTIASVRWVPTTWGRFEGLWAAIGHSVGLVGAALLKLLSERLPDLMLGLLLGPLAVAVFRVGSRGFDALAQLTVVPVRSASLSAYAQQAHVGRLGDSVINSLAIVSMLTFPLFFGAASVARPFVVLVFGEQWRSSAVIMQILCMASPPLLLGAMLQSALSANHDTKLIFGLNAVSAATTFVVLLITVPLYGLVGATVALAIRSYLGMFFNILVTSPVVGMRPWPVIVVLLPALAGSAVMLTSVLALDRFALGPYPEIVAIGMSVLFGMLLYLLIMLTIFREHTMQFLGEWISRMPKLSKLTFVRHVPR
jgi:O-antigen/teichoic acid export membrane protein